MTNKYGKALPLEDMRKSLYSIIMCAHYTIVATFLGVLKLRVFCETARFLQRWGLL
jgi:hypothetical protein